MNCQDINHLLDATAEDLTGTQRDSIERHLATCHACSEDWANFREMSALSIPATPGSLRGRIAAALPARIATPARRTFRPFVVGAVLLACAAAATLFVLKSVSPEPEHVSAVEQQSPPLAAAQPAVAVDAAPVSTKPATAAVAADLAPVPVDSHSIVVLNRPEAAADAQAIAMATQCHDVAVRQLRLVAGLKIIADAAVSSREGGNQVTHLAPSPPGTLPTLSPSDREMARKLGASNVIVISTDGGCSAYLYDNQLGHMISGISGADATQIQNGEWEPFTSIFVKKVSGRILKDPQTEIADFRAALLNATLGDRERVTAFSMLAMRSNGLGGNVTESAFDKDVLAAIISLGTKSPDAGVRNSVWVSLRDVRIYNTSLVQPLLQALANDPDAGARMQAALTLNRFLDQPGVLEALQRAAAEDPSPEPEAYCCFLTVREAAQRASIADKDFRGWVRSALLDESLPARSRLLALGYGDQDGRFVSLADLGADAARMVFDIGQREQNPKVRWMAWNILSRTKPDEAFVPVLVSDLAGNPADYVRAAAAKTLSLSPNPDAREALKRALNDSSMEVRRVAIAATSSGK